MARVPNGTIFSVATVFAAAKTVTGISNASEAVVSSTAHGYSNGDIVEITSGWGRLQKRAFRVKTVLTDSFVLEGADTSNTTLFPPGSGAGTVRKVSTWVQITSVLNPGSSGGEAKKVTYKFLESDVEYSINDGFSAIDRTFDLDADAISSPGYLALRTLTDVQTDTIFRSVAKSGAVTYLPCTITLNEEEKMTDGQIVTVGVAVSGNNRSTRYAS